MVRTNGSFSAYQLCDSRIYEYLIPTHCFLCPHPASYLGRKLQELADQAGDTDNYNNRQKEVSEFWPDIEERYIRPILERYDSTVRLAVIEAFHRTQQNRFSNELRTNSSGEETFDETTLQMENAYDLPAEAISAVASENKTSTRYDQAEMEHGIRQLRAAYLSAKKAYRIHPDRLARIKALLKHFVGTHSYHNYTIQKSHGDPSAKRIIKSFTVNETPILINNTEWLSLKVHGQSFMMHQIRKMVSMVALLIRCGCPERRLQDSFEAERMTIPKAPGSGLLLERPVFDSYNARLSGQQDRQPVSFEPYSQVMETFKQQEIYDRIFREEERDNQCVTISYIILCVVDGSPGFMPFSQAMTI